MKKKVLIVDDEEGIAQFMEDLLERRGFQCFRSLDAEEAWEIYKRENPEICILDVHMPFSKFDGVELLRKIKEINNKTLCVMVSRIDDLEKVRLAQSLGAERYLFKPLDLEALHALIDVLIGLKTEMKEAHNG